MADFSKNEVIETEEGYKIVFDLDDETLKELEAALGLDHTSPDFSSHFENFVNAGIHLYLSNHGGLDG